MSLRLTRRPAQLAGLARYSHTKITGTVTSLKIGSQLLVVSVSRSSSSSSSSSSPPPLPLSRLEYSVNSNRREKMPARARCAKGGVLLVQWYPNHVWLVQNASLASHILQTRAR
jgi:hypothetical protein